jgi:hypothetical protein
MLLCLLYNNNISIYIFIIYFPSAETTIYYILYTLWSTTIKDSTYIYIVFFAGLYIHKEYRYNTVALTTIKSFFDCTNLFYFFSMGGLCALEEKVSKNFLNNFSSIFELSSSEYNI